MEDIEKLSFLREDMLIVYDPVCHHVFKFYVYHTPQSHSRYNTILRRIAQRRAYIKGTVICTGMLVGIALINWFLVWLCFNELTAISMIYMDCMFIRLFFAIAEDVFSIQWLTIVKYKGKIREIKF